MSIIGFIVLAILLWLLYNLFVKVILPVYKTTRQIRQQFKNMAHQREQPEADKPQPEAVKEKVGEYIDFEEVK